MRDGFLREGSDAHCARIAARQHGAIHRVQALDAGLSASGISRRAREGIWQRVLPQVYVFAAAPTTPLQRWMTAVLWAGARSALGRATAAALLGLTDSERESVHIVSTRALKSPSPAIVVHRTRVLNEADVTTVNAITVTTATRTLLDWAADAPEQSLEIALDAALRRGLTSLPRLKWQLEREPTSGRGGRRALRALLEERGSVVSESALETNFRRIVRRFNLPAPVAQHVIRDTGRVVARVDFAYPTNLVAIELDGYEYHSGRLAWRRDLARTNEVVRLGWRVLRFTWRDVRDRPESVAQVVSSALRQAGLGN